MHRSLRFTISAARFLNDVEPVLDFACRKLEQMQIAIRKLQIAHHDSEICRPKMAMVCMSCFNLRASVAWHVFFAPCHMQILEISR